MFKRLSDWFDDRVGFRNLMHIALKEPIRGGARWRYVWGSTLTFVFFLQVITGTMLWLGYSPSAKTAWESVYFIQNEMLLGWLVRGIHHFAAQAMVVLLLFHLVQVVVDGAYKAPREINFWLGLILMQIVLGLGLTGYLLPWDQKGYYATQVATGIVGSTPVVGESLQKLMQGGPEYGHHTLTRFFALHAGILPGLLIAFLALHIYVFRRHGLTIKEPLKRPVEDQFWPDQILKDAVACLAVLAAIMLLAIWKGAELTGPANPAEPYNAARPEWYYLFLFRFLKFPFVSRWGEQTGLGEALGAVVLPGILMGILVAMPVIARIRAGHKFNVLFLWVVIAGAVGLTGVALYEDRFAPAGAPFRFAEHQALLDGHRTVELAKEFGIPADGAGALIAEDPYIQGPKLFLTYCADCHQPTALADMFPRPPQAPALANLMYREDVSFGSREWVKSILTDFKGHMQPLTNITATDNSPEALKERAEAAKGILEGDMANWSTTYGPELLEPENKASLDALVEFLVAQSGRGEVNEELVKQGREVFATGKLAAGEFAEGERCIDCHSMKARGEEEAISEDGYGPNLTAYGGREFLDSIIRDPASHYTNANAMPAFGGQLTDHEIAMLARWLSGEYHRASQAAVAETH